MKQLEKVILEKGRVLNDEVLKVDSFINHQVDPEVIEQITDYFVEQFKDTKVDKVLTIETSGLPIAYSVALRLGVKMVFAKKSKSQIVDDNVYVEEVRSFTRGTVSNVTVAKAYINKDERILIVDDFLAMGNAAIGLINLCEQGGAKCVGFCAAIEKSFQGGRKLIEARGVRVASAAIVKAFVNGKPVFLEE